jgi:ubiquinone/menaquinone biosynthesis C-methylase UbiE
MLDLNKITKLIENEKCNIKDHLFLQRIYKNGLDPYIDRIRQYDFVNQHKVLDAGCGFGQWSLALTQLNTEVYACDAAEKRIEFLNSIVKENIVNNIRIQQGFIDRLPYENEFFDGVFCYGVIFLTPWKKSLFELLRVLKPGGKLYVNANGLGWYKHLWYTAHNETQDYDPRLIAANSWKNTYSYDKNGEAPFPCDLIIEPDQLQDEAERLGLTNIKWDGEGLLGNPENKNTFFQKEYFGDIGVYELMGVKR